MWFSCCHIIVITAGLRWQSSNVERSASLPHGNAELHCGRGG
jgi:hypothetical protein